MPRIASWARSSALIDFSFLKLRPLLASDFKKRLDELFLTNVLPVYPLVAEILNEGWRWWQILSIREYNTVVLLADFSKKMLAIEQSKILASNDFIKMVEAYLRIANRAEYPAALVSIFTRITQAIPHGRDVVESRRIVENLKCFFDPACLSPSFNDMILAYTMVACRRFVEWADIVRPNLPPFVQELYYDCSREVFARILEYLRHLEREIDSLQKQKTTLEWIQGAVDEDVSEMVTSFYAELGRTWHLDNGDAHLLLISLLRGISRALEGLLGDGWQVMTGREKLLRMRIVSDAELSASVEKLTSLVDSAGARYKASSPQGIPLARYLSTGYRASLFPGENIHAVETALSAALDTLFEISLLMRDIAGGSRGDYAGEFYTTHMVDSPIRWRGKSVSDVLVFHIELALHACSLFKARALSRELGRIQLVNQNLDKLCREKKNLDSSGTLGEYVKAMESAQA